LSPVQLLPSNLLSPMSFKSKKKSRPSLSKPTQSTPAPASAPRSLFAVTAPAIDDDCPLPGLRLDMAEERPHWLKDGNATLTANAENEDPMQIDFDDDAMQAVDDEPRETKAKAEEEDEEEEDKSDMAAVSSSQVHVSFELSQRSPSSHATRSPLRRLVATEADVLAAVSEAIMAAEGERLSVMALLGRVRQSETPALAALSVTALLLVDRALAASPIASVALTQIVLEEMQVRPPLTLAFSVAMSLTLCCR